MHPAHDAHEIEKLNDYLDRRSQQGWRIKSTWPGRGTLYVLWEDPNKT
jgi:hypothetical protein